MNSMTNEEFVSNFKNMENTIESVIIGQKDLIRSVLIAILSGGNVLLEGLPGLGKTQLVKAIGKTLDMEFKRIQFTPDLMPQDVTGTTILSKKYNDQTKDFQMDLEFKKGAVFTNILLADEINRATPKTQSALLEAMQEQTVTNGTETYILPNPFFVMATQNHLESEGTYPLPEAQLDRFLFKLNVPFPEKEELMKIIEITTCNNKVSDFKNPIDKPVCSIEDLINMQKLAKEVAVATPVLEYISDIIVKSNPNYEFASELVKKYIRYGSSPRGGQAILMSARVNALINNRLHISFEDVEKVAFNALRHRIFINFSGISDNITPDDIIKELLVR